ncbi:MAG: gamma-glutamyltransferase [Rickettsiales bacterium]|nr:gamma-glutamyltransferase [Rickettsiales bacterium]
MIEWHSLAYLYTILRLCVRIGLILTSVMFCSAFFDYKDNIHPEPKSEEVAKEELSADEFIVVTASKLSSEAGEYIINKGGNAVDAAIASQLVLNLVEPHSSGIGGGGFFIFYDAKSKKSFFYDGRETAPQHYSPEVFLDKDGNSRDFFDVLDGGLTVGVPSLLKLLKVVHEKHGKLKWFELFVPAIDLAENGFEVSPRLETLLEESKHIKNFDNTYEYFYDNIGEEKVRQKIYNHQFAETLRNIAENGIDDFYQGKIAADIVKMVNNTERNPGYLTIEDLARYEVVSKDLLCMKYRKYKVCSIPMPSSGGVAILQTLGILENFDLTQMTPDSAESVHIISEALRLAYVDRNKYTADDRFVYVPVKQMLSKKYLKERSFLINIDSSLLDVKPGEFTHLASFEQPIDHPSTTHLSIVDKAGNAVSFTSSIQYFFGSGLTTHGFLLNNQLTDFAFVPMVNGKKVANRAEAGKKPRSSMSPTLVFDENNKLFMVVGSPGGSRIISYVIKTIVSVLDFNVSINDAVALPNFTKMNNKLEIEKSSNITKHKKALEQKGHELLIHDMTSGIHAILIKDGKLYSGVDPRREGFALGR